MITTEYSVAGPAHISIAIVADLHEFELLLCMECTKIMRN